MLADATTPWVLTIACDGKNPSGALTRGYRLNALRAVCGCGGRVCGDLTWAFVPHTAGDVSSTRECQGPWGYGSRFHVHPTNLGLAAEVSFRLRSFMGSGVVATHPVRGYSESSVACLVACCLEGAGGCARCHSAMCPGASRSCGRRDWSHWVVLSSSRGVGGRCLR